MTFLLNFITSEGMISMVRTSAGKTSLREILFPFRGTWHLPWLIERYLRGALSGLNLLKFVNASLAICEMQLGVVRVRNRPIVLRIEPCNVCNLHCPLCACGIGRDPRKKGFIALNDFARILEENPQAIIVRLDGMGEPMLHPHIFDLVRTAKDAGMSTVLHSNFCAPACDRSDEILDCGLDRLVISVDGATQATYKQYRVGGDLELVTDRILRLVEARRARSQVHPIIEIQMVDFPFNRHEQELVREQTRKWGADRFQITEAERSTQSARFDPKRPRRCPWLWTVLTVGWDLDYRSCTNAWSYNWPQLNLRDLSSREYWNHFLLQEARRYNVNKYSNVIAQDHNCKCNRCYEMVVVPLQGNYFNE